MKDQAALINAVDPNTASKWGIAGPLAQMLLPDPDRIDAPSLDVEADLRALVDSEAAANMKPMGAMGA